MKEALKIYYKLNCYKEEVLTNKKLLKAVYCIEVVHRNLLWRIMEYLYWIIFPRSFSYKRILTIGKFQIKTKFLDQKSKIKGIMYSNDINTIDKLLYDNFPNTDWRLLSEELLQDIVSFYNGDKSGLYIESIKKLINEN
jgi:hypothetical protein